MNEAEFRANVLPLKNKIFRFAKRMLTDWDDAEDAAQEVIMKLWTKRGQLSEKSNLEAFAITVTRNLCIDKMRSKHNRAYPMSDRDMNESEWLITDKTPLKKAEINDTLNIVGKIIGMLPEKQRMLIQLRDVEGYSYDEISNMTGINVNTLKVNLSRARKKIREKFYEITGNEK